MHGYFQEGGPNVSSESEVARLMPARSHGRVRAPKGREALDDADQPIEASDLAYLGFLPREAIRVNEGSVVATDRETMRTAAVG